MPFQVKKKNGVFKLWNIKEKKFTKSSFKTKQSALNQGKNWMRYRKEKPIVKGNFIYSKNTKK